MNFTQHEPESIYLSKSVIVLIDKKIYHCKTNIILLRSKPKNLILHFLITT